MRTALVVAALVVLVPLSAWAQAVAAPPPAQDTLTSSQALGYQCPRPAGQAGEMLIASKELADAPAPPAPRVEKNPCIDTTPVPLDHWAYDAVEALRDQGLIIGFPDESFRGDCPLTRYEFSMLISRLMDTIPVGAAGAVEAIFSVLAIRDGVAPPTLNLEDPSVDSVVDLAPLKAVRRKVDVALSNSFGFGGTNASLVLRRVE